VSYARAEDIPYAVVVERTFVQRVYGWMTLGLVITALVAVAVVQSGLVQPMMQSGIVWGLIIAELLLVMVLRFAIHKMNPVVAGICFIVYAALVGATLAPILTFYTQASIGLTFFVCAGTFGAMSVYGWVTKRDLSSIGNLCFMALFGLIIAMIANFFVGSQMLEYGISVVGVLIFVGLTAYHTQQIKRYHNTGMDGTPMDRKVAIIAALALYLSFINLFLFLLRLMGRRR
jgi:hypothetical protein